MAASLTASLTLAASAAATLEPLHATHVTAGKSKLYSYTTARAAEDRLWYDYKADRWVACRGVGERTVIQDPLGWWPR